MPLNCRHKLKYGVESAFGVAWILELFWSEDLEWPQLILIRKICLAVSYYLLKENMFHWFPDKQ